MSSSPPPSIDLHQSSHEKEKEKEKDKKKKKGLLSPRKKGKERKPSTSGEDSPHHPDNSSDSASPRTITTNQPIANQQKPVQISDFADLEDQPPIEIQSQVEKHLVSTVTVYSTRAEVVRTCDFEFPTVPAQYRITLKGFPLTVDPQSIRMSIPVQYGTILEVSYQEKLETEEEKQVEERHSLEKRKEEILKLIEEQDAEIQRITKGLDWTEAFRKGLIPSDKELVDVDASWTYLEFLISEQVNLRDLKNKKRDRLSELQMELNEVEIELQKLIPKSESVKIVQVLLLVHTKPQQQPDHQLGVELSYLVDGGTWTSGYQARLTERDNMSPLIELTYYATITNSSGEHWNDCELLLSTAVPSNKGEMPLLLQTKLRIQPERPKMMMMKSKRSMVAPAPVMSFAMMADDGGARNRLAKDSEEEEEPMVNDLQAVVETKGSTTTYRIPRKATIPSDYQPHKVTVAGGQFEANVRYKFVPLVSSHAFRLAECVNTSELEFLPGPVHVFVNQSLVTVTQLKHTHPQQEFSVYLGVDPTVLVSHTKRSFVKTVGMFHSSHEDRVETFFQIANHSSATISGSLMAQLPLATQSGYEVKIVQPNLSPNTPLLKDQKIKLDEYNNVVWEVTLKKDQHIEIPFTYIVSFPLNTSYELS